MVTTVHGDVARKNPLIPPGGKMTRKDWGTLAAEAVALLAKKKWDRTVESLSAPEYSGLLHEVLDASAVLKTGYGGA